MNIKEVNYQTLNKSVAAELETRIKMPEWGKFIKTGISKQRPPEQTNYWYLRAASIMRRIYIDGPVGVQRLRSYYGSSKNMGHQPSHFKRGSGKIIRTILQDLEKIGYIKKIEKPKKGRILTKEGKRFMEEIAKQAK